MVLGSRLLLVEQYLNVAKKKSKSSHNFCYFKILWYFKSFKFILESGKPHKTVISISIGGGDYKLSEDDKIYELVKRSFIIVMAAGNESIDYCKKNYQYSLDGNKDTISVRAIASLIYYSKYFNFIFFILWLTFEEINRTSFSAWSCGIYYVRTLWYWI